MSGRLVALDKMPGVRPVGIGEVWRRLFAKAVLLVAGPEATEACGADQLCAGLSAGIEGGVHAMRVLWAQHQHEEHWGIFLADARNAFNTGNRFAFLWTVRHLWPSGARFAFNCYRHWSIMVVRTTGNTTMAVIIIHSQEGVTQGCPLAMIIYGIGNLPLVRELKQQVPDVIQPWFADDASGGGKFLQLGKMIRLLIEKGPARGYFLEPTKSILIVRPSQVASAITQFADVGLTIVTGHRYLGGYLGEPEDERRYIEQKVEAWEEGVEALSKIAKNHPQAAYAGMQRSLQQEWQFLQRVTEDLGPTFCGIEERLAKKFIPALFGTELEDPAVRILSTLPVKEAGMAIPNPTKTARQNYNASTVAVGHLVQAIRGRDQFRPADHYSVIQSAKKATLERKQDQAKDTLRELSAKMSKVKSRTILRGKETGGWLSLMPSMVSGTELSPQEFRDSLHLRYHMRPKDLPKECDGCGHPFSIQHALACKKGGLVHARHDEVRDEVADLAVRAFTPSSVRYEPAIHPHSGTGTRGKSNNSPHSPNTSTNDSHSSQATSNPQARRSAVETDSERRGDILIRGLWARGTDAIIDVRVTDTDQKSYQKRTPAKILHAQETEKKNKYLKDCLDQRRHFSPFVVSTDGMLAREADHVIKAISKRLATKWQRQYSDICGYVKARISIAIVRATHRTLRGSRVPTSRMSNALPQWEDGAGLGLCRW